MAATTYQRNVGVGTFVIKNAPGYLARILARGTGGVNSTVTLYDNTVGAGTVIAQFVLTQKDVPVPLEFGVKFHIGLTMVTSGDAPDITVMYE